MAPCCHDAEFSTVDGVTLRGWFYPGGGDDATRAVGHGCIIMAHGLASVKEHFLPSFAERFQAAGYAVLLYDHRNWGASDGRPRNETNPIQQGQDLADAFDYAASLAEVDATRIVYWGCSMSGGAAIHAAAFDKRIRAVIALTPFVSGGGLLPLVSADLEAYFASRQIVRAGGVPPLVKLFPETAQLVQDGDSSALLHDPSLFDFVKSLEEKNLRWDPNVTPQTLLNILAFEPHLFIDRVAPTPILVIAAGSDTSSPTILQLRAYESAKEPKKLILLKGSRHFDPYQGQGFEDTVKAQLAFLAEVL